MGLIGSITSKNKPQAGGLLSGGGIGGGLADLIANTVANSVAQAAAQTNPAPQPTPAVQQVANIASDAVNKAKTLVPAQPTLTQKQRVTPAKPVRQTTPVTTPSVPDVASQYYAQMQGQADEARKYLEMVKAQSADYTPITIAQEAYANRGTPYLDIAKAYEDRARENFANQQDAMARQLATSKASTGASYDSAAAGNYINYMKQQNALPEQLARQGVNGGASESALTRIANNYALNQGNTAASRAAAMGALQNTYDTNLANLRQALEENVMNNNMTLAQAQAQYDDVLAQRVADEIWKNADTERAVKERREDIVRDAELRLADIIRGIREQANNWAREDDLTNKANEREDRLTKEARDYEDYIRGLTWNREDELTDKANARDDYLRNLTWAREDEKEAAANAREDARYAYEKQATEQQTKQEEEWKQKEWEASQIATQIEQFAAGLLKYTSIDSLKKLADNIKKDSKWASDPLKYGKVKAIDNRIGVIKAEKKK